MAFNIHNDVLMTTFVAVEGAHAFSAFMPSYFTVKKFAGNQSDIAALRSGYYPAAAFNILLGGLVSLIMKSSYPIFASAGVIVVMIVLYEGAIGSQSKQV